MPPGLAALDRGGTPAIAGIHLTDIPPLNYQRHLFRVRSVTSDTRAQAREFLAVAGAHRLGVATSPYRLDQADDALADLAADRVHGAAVLVRQGGHGAALLSPGLPLGESDLKAASGRPVGSFHDGAL